MGKDKTKEIASEDSDIDIEKVHFVICDGMMKVLDRLDKEEVRYTRTSSCKEKMREILEKYKDKWQKDIMREINERNNK